MEDFTQNEQIIFGIIGILIILFIIFVSLKIRQHLISKMMEEDDDDIDNEFDYFWD